MKRFAILLTATVALFVCNSVASAGWGSLHYGGYQPWWNIFAHRNHHLTHEEQRLQRFWHDYYDAMRRYYDLLDNIDWVAYYKNHGYQINSGGYGGCGPCGGSQRVQFAPVVVTPGMSWGVPNNQLSGAPCGPMMPPPAAFMGAGMGHASHYPQYPQMPQFPGYGSHASYYPPQQQYPNPYQQQYPYPQQ